VRDERQHDGEEDPDRLRRVQQREIDEGDDAGRDRADEVDPLMPEAMREMAGQQDGHERHQVAADQRHQQEVARRMPRKSRRSARQTRSSRSGMG